MNVLVLKNADFYCILILLLKYKFNSMELYSFARLNRDLRVRFQFLKNVFAKEYCSSEYYIKE